MKDVKGKVVLITGGAAGIGLCTAHEFGKAGSTLVLTDVNAQALEDAARELGDAGYPVTTFLNDVSDRAAVEALTKELLEKFGAVDVLINNAGVGFQGEMKDMSLEDWDRLMNINFFGPLNFIYALMPSMIEKRSGHIVNLSSGQAFFMLPTWGAYASIKLGMAGMSEVLHYELSKYNIQVTTVYPFMVNTGFYDDVESETFGSRMSMKLLPYYSNTPQTVAKRIFKAVKKGKSVEMVNVLNSVGFYTKFFRPLHAGVSIMSNWFLAKRD